MTLSPIADSLRNRYGPDALSGTQPFIRGFVHLYIEDSWKDFTAMAGLEGMAPPYAYVVDSLFAKPYSITQGAKEFIVVDMRMYFHLSMLTRATMTEFSTDLLTFAFGRLYAEKLYLAHRFRESATQLLTSNSVQRRHFFRGGEWFSEATVWQLRFILAHELCHTVIRLSPEFRKNSLRTTRDLLGRITMDESRHGNRDKSELFDWLDKHIPSLSKNLETNEEEFSWTRESIANVEESSLTGGDLASVRDDDSWLEEVTCDIQAALHLMRQAKDEQELVKFSVYVTMALSNLRTMGHFEALAKDYSDFAFKDVIESKLRRVVVTTLMASENWRDFTPGSPNEEPQRERGIFCGPWESPKRRVRVSRDRAQAIVHINNAWHTNVLSPLLVVYPQVAVYLSTETAQRRGPEIAELEDNPVELRRVIDAMFRTDGSATAAPQEGDADLGQADSTPPSDAVKPLIMPQAPEEAVDTEAAFRMVSDSEHPQAPLVALGLAGLLVERGDDDGAEAAFRLAADSTDVDAAPLAAMALAVRLEAQGNARGAEAAYRRVIDSGHPDAAPMAAVSLGVLLQWRDDAQGAEAAYRRAAESGHPTQAPMGWMGLGVLLHARDDAQGAAAAYRRAIDSRDANQAPMAAFNLGLLLEGEDDDGAETAFRYAADSGHADAAPIAAVRLGFLLHERGDAEGAEAAFRYAADSEDPNLAPVAACNLGVLLLGWGDDDGAETAFRRAAASGHAEGGPTGASSLGFLLHERGDAQGAEDLYRQAVDSGHADAAPNAAVGLGVLLQERGDAQGAEASFRLAMDSGHTDAGPAAAMALAGLLRERGDVDGAEAAYRLAAESGHGEVAPMAAAALTALQEREDADDGEATRAENAGAESRTVRDD